MINMKLGFIGTALLFAYGALYAAEPAGKVLILQGAASASRAGKEIPLERGVVVETGDVIRVGDASSLQIRFADESIVALRANTVFGIEKFTYALQEKTGSSFFNLIKGGMRTITGLIGKTNPDNYMVKNTNATIGIRGTHFTAVSCAGDCFNADGSKADDGLFGSVTDGRIVVVNSVGETEFGRDQFFFAQTGILPQQLLIPPAFLRDKLDGQAKSKGKAATAAVSNAGGDAALAPESPAGTTGQSIISADSARISTTLVTDTTFVPASSPRVEQAVTGGVTGGVAVASFSEAFAGLENYSGRNSSGTYSGQDGYTYGNQIVFESNNAEWLAVQAAGIATPVDYYKSAYSGTSTYSDSVNGVTYTDTYTKTASVDVGSSVNAGNVTWGRYSESGTETGSDGSTRSWSEVAHWALGDPVSALPTSGVFTYNPIGGTSPTDIAGTTGAMTSRGQWSVDFGGKTIATTQAVSWNMPNGAAYTVAVPNQSFQVISTSEPGYATVTTLFANAATGSNLTTTTACSGACVSATADVGVTAYGAQAQGLGAAVTARGALNAGGQQVSGMVNVYQR